MAIAQRHFKDDLNYGIAKEEPIMIRIQNHFNKSKLVNTKEKYGDQYCHWDFESEDGIKYELKTRRNRKNAYPTTIIPVHKAGEGELYFMFEFTDGLYYIKFDKEVFKTFGTRMIQVKRIGRYDPPTLHYEIPVNLLEQII